MIAGTSVTEHDGPDVAAHLAVEQGLLFQTKVLRGVGHDGEGGFWIVPKREEVRFIFCDLCELLVLVKHECSRGSCNYSVRSTLSPFWPQKAEKTDFAKLPDVQELTNNEKKTT